MKNLSHLIQQAALLCCLVIVLSISANAASPQSILGGYEAEAKIQDQHFQEFSAKRGQLLFQSTNTTGKPETPSCTTCHSKDPSSAGRTRAEKEISPMALSRSPQRYNDLKKVEKWFRRNCKSVLGRVCSPLEKGDFITFMINQ